MKERTVVKVEMELWVINTQLNHTPALKRVSALGNIAAALACTPCSQSSRYGKNVSLSHCLDVYVFILKMYVINIHVHYLQPEIFRASKWSLKGISINFPAERLRIFRHQTTCRTCCKILMFPWDIALDIELLSTCE